MLKVSEVLSEIFDKNSFLNFGLAHNLLNLSQTAKWIQPMVEARLKKDVSTSAILMALCRALKMKTKVLPSVSQLHLVNINVYNNLCELTFDKNSTVRGYLDKVYREVHKKSGYITITQGIGEITLIVNKDLVELVKNEIQAKPKFQKNNLAALGVQFASEYVENIGTIYYLIQQLTLQGINIWELSSTYTELIFYLAQKDLQLAFDTLYRRFGQ